MLPALFDRKNPLFEQPNIHCEVICRETCNHNRHDKKIESFTLRLLEGRRACHGSYQDERVIRFEISDECPFASLSDDYVCRSKTERGQEWQHESPGNDFMAQSNVSFSDDVAHGRENLRIQLQRTPLKSKQSWEPSSRGRQSAMRQPRNCVERPIQIYELEVGESDFGELRQDQSLLVNFNEFAISFVSFLKKCVASDKGPCPNAISEGAAYSAGGFTNASGSAQYYYCRLEEIPTGDLSQSQSDTHSSVMARNRSSGTTRFRIVESNQFRELTQLSLTLTNGSDSSTRSYLSVRLEQMMNESAGIRGSLRHREEHCEALETDNRELQAQIKQLRMSFEADRRKCESLTAKQAQTELSRQQQAHAAAIETKERDVLELERKLEQRITALEHDARVLEGERSSLKVHAAKLENELREERDALDCKQSMLAGLKTEVKEWTTQVNNLKEEGACLKERQEEQDNKSRMIKESAEVMGSALEEAKLSAEKASLAERNTSQRLELVQRQLEAEQVKVSTLLSEMSKARELVQKLHADRTEMKQKLKTKSSAAKSNDKSLTEAKTSLHEARGKLAEFEKQLSAERAGKESTEAELLTARSKLSESAKLLESNQEVW
jgi:spindle assembly abnormal protein 6